MKRDSQYHTTDKAGFKVTPNKYSKMVEEYEPCKTSIECLADVMVGRSMNSPQFSLKAIEDYAKAYSCQQNASLVEENEALNILIGQYIDEIGKLTGVLLEILSFENMPSSYGFDPFEICHEALKPKL